MIVRLVTLLALGALAAGCAAGTLAATDPTINRAADRNGQLSNHARMLRMALEQYATDHNGEYPPDTDALMRLVVSPTPAIHYMPGNRLPADPWSTEGTPVALVDGAAFPLASAFEGLEGPTPSDPLAAPGLPAAARRPGALIYAHDAAKGSYYIVAVGEKAGRAALVDAVSATERARPEIVPPRRYEPD